MTVIDALNFLKEIDKIEDVFINHKHCHRNDDVELPFREYNNSPEPLTDTSFQSVLKR
jgi:hypothetical protein